MLVCIPAVLDWTELKKVRAAIAEGSFEDGRRTAGRRAKRVKNNLQLKKGDDRADEIKDIVLAAAVGARNRMGGGPLGRGGGDAHSQRVTPVWWWKRRCRVAIAVRGIGKFDLSCAGPLF